MPYTNHDRQQAVALYIEHGTAEASRRTGISPTSIKRWANHAGAVNQTNTKQTEAARAVLQARNDQRRERVREALLERVEALLESIDGDDPAGARNLAIAVGVLIDKYRLESGEATTRNEHVDQSIDNEIRQLVAELGQRGNG